MITQDSFKGCPRRGQGLTEYLLIVGLISFGLVTVVGRFSGSLKGAFQAATTQLSQPLVSNNGHSPGDPFPGNSVGGRGSSSRSSARSNSSTAAAVSAEPATGSVHLSWQAPETRTDGTPIRATELSYRVYYGTASGRYDETVDLGPATEIRLHDLEVGKRMFFAISTRDASGVESALSNEVSKVVTANQGSTS